MHRTRIERTTRQAYGITWGLGRNHRNYFDPAWYITCTCGWREKAGTETVAITRATRHAQGYKLP